jgi:folate-binding protein YgfZ
MVIISLSHTETIYQTSGAEFDVVNGVRWGYIFSQMARESSLADFHRRNGAVFVESDDWLLPARFGAHDAEYNAVRSAVGLIDFSHRGLLQFTGADRFSFLQGMLSNDLLALKPFAGHYSTVLNQQGKVLADVRVLCAMNSLYLDFWESLKDKIVTHLSRYLVADEVEIADRSEAHAILSLQGPQAEALLLRLAGQAELPRLIAHHVMIDVDGASICVVRASHTGEAGFDLIMPKTQLINIAHRLTDTGKQFSAAWIGQEALDTLRIEAGIPRYGTDFGEDNLLLETGLDDHVSFTKGCYLGQEIVERVRSRGHVNKRLSGMLIDGAIPARHGDPIRVGEKPVGMITSSVYSPTLKRAIALGYIHRDYWEPGTPATVASGTGFLGASVTELPFVRS